MSEIRKLVAINIRHGLRATVQIVSYSSFALFVTLMVAVLGNTEIAGTVLSLFVDVGLVLLLICGIRAVVRLHHEIEQFGK